MYTIIVLTIGCTVISVATSWRLELFFKSKKDLQDRVVPFLKENGIKRVNITNKVRQKLLVIAGKSESHALI